MSAPAMTWSDLMTTLDAAREAATHEAITALPEVARLLMEWEAAPSGSPEEAIADAAHEAAYDAAMAQAQEREREAEVAMAAYDGPRPWRLRYLDESGYEETLAPCSIKRARRLARESVEGGDWDRSETFWVDVAIVDPATGEDAERVTVTVDAEEPDCDDGHGHDWCSPIEVVGGIAENPGVWGNGGGIVAREVCRRCGCVRVTDTWAQRPDTGEQGLTSVSYETDDEDALAWAEAQRAGDEP